MKLEDFHWNFPKYAILSHRWIEKQEATFGDLVESPEQLDGHRKIRNFCQKARDAHYDYVWVDTCCIDKKGSAELSEAINSMYRWYADAEICYVYLADVDDGVDLERSLLAPPALQFFDSGWRRIASRQELAPRLERITAIPQKSLQQFIASEYSVAVKMSWAARRETSRQEDRAYCLLGIFDVNMPLLYGEGSKAFQRLQEEIMKSSTDSSLFLWRGSCCTSFGMLAADPASFSNIPDCLNEEHLQTSCKMFEGWTYNNAGMTITGMVRPYLLGEGGETVFVLLLHKPFTTRRPCVGIFVEQDIEYRRNISYRPVAVDGHTWIEDRYWVDMSLVDYWPFESRLQQLFITRDAVTQHYSTGTCSFTVYCDSGHGFRSVAKGRPTSRPGDKLKDWLSCADVAQGPLECVFEVERKSAIGLLGHIIVHVVDDVDLLICLGLDDCFRPICIIVPFSRQTYHEKLSAYDILRAYHNLLLDSEDADYAFDTVQHIIALRGTDGVLEASTKLGVDLSIEGAFSSKFAASISFDADLFLQHYLPSARTLGPQKVGCLGADDAQGLIDKESEIVRSRRQRLWI